MTQLLMPKATAVWLIDNSALTFEQIGAFCNLHPLEAVSYTHLTLPTTPYV